MSMKGKKKPRLLYKKETLREAIAAIQAGMPINAASHKFQIPRSTLHNKKSAKYEDKRPGPDTVLTTAEENALVQWIFNCSKQGMMVSKQQLLNSVALLVKHMSRENPFSNGRPGRHWYQSFLRRHENVVDRINENSQIAKLPALEEDIKKWFGSLRTYLEEKKLINIPPSRIFITETCALLSPDVGVVDEDNLFVQMTASADGCLAPPMVMFAYQRIPGKIYEALPKGWTCSKSENGSMTAENLYDYMTKNFFPWLLEKKVDFPVVLFLDGRVPHLTLLLSDFCLRNKIHLVGIVPNSSQVLHPLNVAIFSPLKAAWKQALADYRWQSKAVNLQKESVAPLLKSVLDALQADKLIIDGFEACGLHPLSENAINYEKVPKKVVEKAKIERKEFTPFAAGESFEAQNEEPSSETGLTAEFLSTMELNLNPDTLSIFRSYNDYADWTGRIEDTALFYFWRKVRIAVENPNSQQDNTDANYDAVISETDVHSTLSEVKHDLDLFIEDPLKLCVAEMDET